MKRTISLALAILFLFALFAGCGPANSGNTGGGANNTGGGANNAGGGANNAGGANTPADGGSADAGTPEGETDAPAAPVLGVNKGADAENPYNFAKGKYLTDEEGWPLEKYAYELPITVSDEIFTQMTLNFSPQYLPEDGYAGIPTYAQAAEMTGVHIEYNVIAAATYSDTLSVKEASDDLDDITGGYYAYHTGSTLTQCIEDEIIANIYDYREYCPNYCRWGQDFKWIDAMWGNVNNPSQTMWIGFVDFYDEPCQTTGYFLREDWMHELGLGDADGFTTFDEWYDILYAFIVNGKCEHPFITTSGIDFYANVWNAFNTTPAAGSPSFRRVIDGKVYFNGTTPDDLELMQYLNKWFNDGIIDPNYASYTTNDDMREPLTNDRVGAAFFNPSEVLGWETSSINPNCTWEPTLRLRKTPDQIIHWNLDPDEFGGTGSSISGACENIELVVSYIDWCYSDFGAEWMNWGPQGYGWDYNEKGEKEWTDLVLNFDLGVGWATMCYFFNPMDAGVNMWTRNYAYPGGERLRNMFSVWDSCLDYYDGAYNYPATIKLSDEDADEEVSIRADLNTFFNENYILFLDNSKPFSEWDSFQKQLSEMGMDDITAIYQRYYDAYIAAA